MDMEQLLLLMEGVFDQIEYKYLVEGCRIKVIPLSHCEKEYLSLVDRTDPLYDEAKILQVSGQEDWADYTYESVDQYRSELPHIKDHLYFLTILFYYVNCTGILPGRENVVHNFLLNDKNGKDYVSCLITMTLYLLVSYRDGGCEKANHVIKVLNQSYMKMQELYGDKGKILKDMQRRNRNYKNIYRDGFFINQALVLDDWINNHINVNNIFEFVFYRNKILKSYAIHFMQHITKISEILMKDERITFQWESENELGKNQKMHAFCRLDKMLNELEQERGNPTFDINSWISHYTKELYRWAQINNFCE